MELATIWCMGQNSTESHWPVQGLLFVDESETEILLLMHALYDDVLLYHWMSNLVVTFVSIAMSGP